MAIYRVHKNKNYTTIDNNIFKNKDMSYKTTGLLCTMLSLPDDWNFNIAGLVSLKSDKDTVVRTALQELEELGYLTRTKVRSNSGTFIDWQYDIYEEPLVEKPQVENPQVEKPHVENQAQLNTNKLNTKELNNKKKIIKEKYGTYGRVKLTIDEYLRLVNEFGEDFIKERIDLLDEYIESNNNKNKYTNFNLVLRRAIREKWFENKLKGGSSSFTETMKKLYDEQTNDN